MPPLYRAALTASLAALLTASMPSAWAQAASSPPSSADRALGSPYAATVPVDDSSEAARQIALKRALQVVITAVTGGLAATPESLLRPDSLVNYYGYVRDAVSGELKLTAEFDRQAVNSRLRDAGLPIFGVAGGAASDVAVSIEGVDSARDFARMLDYLQRIPGVTDVAVTEVSDSTVQLQLRVEGGESRLGSSIGGGNILRVLAPGYYSLAH